MSLSLLAMSSQDLREAAYEETLKNPALEIASDSFESGAERASERYRFSDNTRISSVSYSGQQASDNFQEALEAASDDRESLQDNLRHQFLSERHSAAEESLGVKLIGNLDSNGFHILAPESLIDEKSGEDAKTLEKCLSDIQRLDPVGTCVKNVTESLFVQAKIRGDAPKAALFILDGHFDFLNPPVAEKILKKISSYFKERDSLIFAGEKEKSDLEKLKKSPFTLHDVEEALAFIRTLDPRPARNFSSSVVNYVSPDVYVEKIPLLPDDDNPNVIPYSENVGFLVRPAKEDSLRLAVARDFKNLADDRSRVRVSTEESEKKRAEHKFAADSVRKAEEFIESVKFRESTVLRAAVEIVNEQTEFFAKGPRFLKPLRQKDLAEKLELSESTISRAATGKYLQCEWGLFNLGYFFTNAVQTSAANPLSSKESVKEEIRLILQAQKPGEKTLSDQKISDLLAQKGIKVARRTVAKYRGELNIDSSYGR